MRRQLIYRDYSVGKKESITKMKLIENSVPILYIIEQHPNYIALLCFLELQWEMGETLPYLCHGLYSLLLSFTMAAPLPCQPVFTIKIRSICKYLSCFFIKQSKSPDAELVFASKGGKPEANQGNALLERQGPHVRTWVKTKEALFYVHTATL